MASRFTIGHAVTMFSVTSTMKSAGAIRTVGWSRKLSSRGLRWQFRCRRKQFRIPLPHTLQNGLLEFLPLGRSEILMLREAHEGPHSDQHVQAHVPVCLTLKRHHQRCKRRHRVRATTFKSNACIGSLRTWPNKMLWQVTDDWDPERHPQETLNSSALVVAELLDQERDCVRVHAAEGSRGGGPSVYIVTGELS